MRVRGLVVGAVAFLLASLVAVGCGGGETVVTVTTTETVMNAPVASSVATEADRAWAELIRRQEKEVDAISLDIEQGDTTPLEAALRVTTLENDLRRAGLRGASPCIQEVAAEWEMAFGRFRDLFAMLAGAIPEVARAAGEKFDKGPPLRTEAAAVLASLENCLASLGGLSAGPGPSSGGSGDGTADAISTWVSEAPASADGTPREGLVWLLHEHGKLNTAGWTVSKSTACGSATKVRIRAKQDPPVYIDGEKRADLGTEPLFLDLFVEVVGGAAKVTAATGGNFYWKSSDASQQTLQNVNGEC
jgi:hypothetical protein